MAKKDQPSFESLIQHILRKEFKPVYLLMGEESYYIDRITEAILENALEESERDFNEIVRYGADTSVETIIEESRFYPSFSRYRVVVIKEAQEIKKLDDLVAYVLNHVATTILVINHKNGTLDGRKKLTAEIEKIGVVFESKKVYDNQLPSWINGYVGKKGKKIDAKACAMLADFIGQDLNRIVSEIEKLLITMPVGQSVITPELVERNIGISKEYNNFEFLKAVVTKDILKSNRIAQYFERNPKNNPLVLSLIVLYNYFSNLMLCHYLPQKTENAVMQGLKISPFQTKDYLLGLKNYSPLKTMQIISLIRQYDAKGKGVGSVNIPDGELLRELLVKILHN
jgi:DNA polymerase-3 subunit delta